MHRSLRPSVQAQPFFAASNLHFGSSPQVAGHATYPVTILPATVACFLHRPFLPFVQEHIFLRFPLNIHSTESTGFGWMTSQLPPLNVPVHSQTEAPATSTLTQALFLTAAVQSGFSMGVVVVLSVVVVTALHDPSLRLPTQMQTRDGQVFFFSNVEQSILVGMLEHTPSFKVPSQTQTSSPAA